MKKKERNFLVNIMWKPVFAAIMTAVLARGTGFNPFIIAAILGAASSAACYLDYRVFLTNQES